MLNNKDRAKLRGLASTKKAVFNVGKDGISSTIIEQMDNYLNAHELMKIAILDNANLDIKESGYQLANLLGAELVETKGKTAVIYKKTNKDNFKHILE